MLGAALGLVFFSQSTVLSTELCPQSSVASGGWIERQGMNDCLGTLASDLHGELRPGFREIAQGKAEGNRAAQGWGMAGT